MLKFTIKQGVLPGGCLSEGVPARGCIYQGVYLPGGLPAREGVYLPKGAPVRGCTYPGVCIPNMHWGRHPLLWTQWLTGTCEKYYFAATSLRQVINPFRSFAHGKKSKCNLELFTITAIGQVKGSNVGDSSSNHFGWILYFSTFNSLCHSQTKLMLLTLLKATLKIEENEPFAPVDWLVWATFNYMAILFCDIHATL